MKDHLKYVLIAFFVTILWSSSWVIIKFGLDTIPPLIFASMRYLLASFLLLIFTLRKSEYVNEIKNMSKKYWIYLIIYGLIFITLTQGLQFVGLTLFPAITLSFVLNFTTIFVILISIPLLREFPNNTQLILILIALFGGMIYFYPFDFQELTTGGLLVLLFILLSNAGSSMLGRYLNKARILSSVVITTVSMSIGSIILFVFAFFKEQIPNLSFTDVFYIAWLAIFNTVIAFTLWNYSLQKLKAFEITIINNTMLPQITILALIFLNEIPTLLEWIGILVITVTAILIQLKSTPMDESKNK